MPSIDDLLKTVPTTGNSVKSSKWYKAQVRSLFNKGITGNSLMANSRDRLVSNIVPGKMYLFMYDPKHKDTLPYYDTFPLVLPYGPAKDGFMGLNFHYLPYPFRLGLLDKLNRYVVNRKSPENTKIKVSWAILSRAAMHPVAKVCVKHYLYHHVQTRFLQLEAVEWEMAMMLPVETFVGAPKTKVWTDSRHKMGA